MFQHLVAEATEQFPYVRVYMRPRVAHYQMLQDSFIVRVANQAVNAQYPCSLFHMPFEVHQSVQIQVAIEQVPFAHTHLPLKAWIRNVSRRPICLV